MPSKTKGKTLHYFIVADASSSMSDQIDEVRDELNKHFKVLQQTAKDSKNKINVSFCTFNSEISWKFNGSDSDALPLVTREMYHPNGMTALFDAIEDVIVKAAKSVGDRDSKLESVWIMIFSDGQENASRHCSVQKLRELLDAYQNKEGWNITFTGCDPAGMQQMMETNFRFDRVRSYEPSEKGKAHFDLSNTMMKYCLNDFDEFDFKKPE